MSKSKSRNDSSELKFLAEDAIAAQRHMQTIEKILVDRGVDAAWMHGKSAVWIAAYLGAPRDSTWPELKAVAQRFADNEKQKQRTEVKAGKADRILKVAKYVQRNPDASQKEIAEATGISRPSISRYLRKIGRRIGRIPNGSKEGPSKDELRVDAFDTGGQGEWNDD
jgi:predicted XRE-type DNA-binding protein